MSNAEHRSTTAIPVTPSDETATPVAQPASTAPVAAEPVAAQPTVVEPTVVEPAAVEPVVAEPVASEPVASEPSNEEFRAMRREAYNRERAEFGGFKFGSAFFGWLSATGLTIILTAIVAGTGVALGLGQQATDAVAGTADTTTTTAIGIGGLVAVVVILFVSYLAGGYVAGRMARFSGMKQGVAVWLWAMLAAIVLGIVAAIAGQPVLANLNTFPRIPINEGTLTTTGIIVAVLAALVPLVAAVLGGLAGMRFHRKVDRVGFGA
jgi:hypothetical protein